MLLKILRFILGYVKVEVFGFAPERLMNLIIKNEIIVWEVEHTEQGYCFFTGRKKRFLIIICIIRFFVLKSNKSF